uniref:Uncharacterized protein n=1 Tax=Lepeophtheirus salmonis TaxID=72036 RepID=A0A0K2SVC3_LEPSM
MSVCWFRKIQNKWRTDEPPACPLSVEVWEAYPHLWKALNTISVIKVSCK